MTDETLKTIFSSQSGVWETPQEFFDELNKEFHFELDAAAIPENAKCDNFFSPEDDGLAQNWGGGRTIWCNPPYGRDVVKWVQKAYEASQNGSTVVMLLFARTDTKWFHDYIYGKAEIRFVRGRIKFGGSKNSAPFPSMVVIFRPGKGDAELN